MLIRNTNAFIVINALFLWAIASTSHAREISYSYLESSYITLTDSSRSEDVDATGFEAKGSFNLFEYLAIGASVGGLTYDTINQREITQTNYALSLIGHVSVAQSTDLFLEASALEQDLEINFANDIFTAEYDENGYGVSLGVRHMLSQNIELGAIISQFDIFETNEQGNLNIRYYIGEQLSLGVAYTTGEDVDAYLFNVRFNIK